MKVILKVVLTISLFTGCATKPAPPAATDRPKPNLTDTPTIIPAYPIGKVDCALHVENYSSATSQLRGFVELTNSTEWPQIIVLTAFFLHLRVCDENGKQVLFAKGLPVIDVAVTKVMIEAGKSERRPFDLRVADYYDLTPGRIYKITFVYDDRLNDVLNIATPKGAGIRRWSKDDLVVAFTGASTNSTPLAR